MDPKVLDNYNSEAGTKRYTRKFEKHWTERINNFHEQRLVRSLLRNIPHCRLALDLPSGYGRLFPLVQSACTRVIEGDWSFHMLSEARERLSRPNPLESPVGYVRATAIKLPFEDRAFDLVFSVRLCHHMNLREERLQYIRELLRISAQSVIFTYFDSDSLKNRIHKLRGRIRKQRSNFTLNKRDVQQLAAEANFHLTRTVPLSTLFSGHQYTVMTRAKDLT